VIFIADKYSEIFGNSRACYLFFTAHHFKNGIEVVFPKIPMDYKPSAKVMAMTLGKLQELTWKKNLKVVPAAM